MKRVIFAALLILSSTASFAQTNISVLIDGKTYSCSEGSNGGNCTQKLKVIKSKYAACLNSYGASTCFNSAFANFDKSCEEVVAYCYSTCQNSYGASTCFNSCY